MSIIWNKLFYDALRRGSHNPIVTHWEIRNAQKVPHLSVLLLNCVTVTRTKWAQLRINFLLQKKNSKIKPDNYRFPTYEKYKPSPNIISATWPSGRDRGPCRPLPRADSKMVSNRKYEQDSNVQTER